MEGVEDWVVEGCEKLSAAYASGLEIFYPRLSAQIRGKCFVPPLPHFLCVSKVLSGRPGMRYCRGGVFLTVITTSHAPFAINSKIAGKKYLLTDT